MKSIFTDNFPYITNDLELEALKIAYPDYDPYYIASGSIEERKAIFDRLYQQYYPYADKHFLPQIKIKFNQRSWEMYLGCCLLNRHILFSSKDEGPDFQIDHEGKKIWIECIAPEKGNTVDRVPDLQYGVVQSVPTNEMLIRIAASLKEKHSKYKKYIENGIISEEDVFIIAICTGDLRHVDAVIPLILRAVFAIGYPTLSNPHLGPVKRGWSTITSVKKNNGSEVPMTFFLEKQYEGVSAVMYTNKDVLNHPKNLGEDIVLVYNELAKNPLPRGILDSFKYYKFDKNGSIEV